MVFIGTPRCSALRGCQLQHLKSIRRIQSSLNLQQKFLSANFLCEKDGQIALMFRHVLSKVRKKQQLPFLCFFSQEQRAQNVSKRSRTITKPFQIALWRPMTELDSDPFLQELIQSLPQCSTLEEWRRCHIKQRWENSHKQCRQVQT